MTNPKCPICFGIGWVCENHPDKPWTVSLAASAVRVCRASEARYDARFSMASIAFACRSDDLYAVLNEATEVEDRCCRNRIQPERHMVV